MKINLDLDYRESCFNKGHRDLEREKESEKVPKQGKKLGNLKLASASSRAYPKGELAPRYKTRSHTRKIFLSLSLSPVTSKEK